MRVVFLGPPGAGKGTVAKLWSRRHALPHISTGDLLRGHIREKTGLGKKAASYVEAGRLVPDDLVIEMMRERLLEADASRGFILDGFPRTEGQAQALGAMLQEEGMALDHALNFEVTDETILRRLAGRRTCERCGEIYHVTNIPPKREGRCDRCEGTLIQREDDKAETILKRLEVYRKETAPVIGYYGKEGLLRSVSGDLEVRDLEPILQKLLV